MTTLEITHTMAEGTLLTGDPRPHHTILKEAGWRWSRNLGAWYIRLSRDHEAYTGRIDATAEALRAAGFEVTVSIDNTPRKVAEREADRAARSAARQEGLTRKAERLDGQGRATLDEAHKIADMIPFGQPILVGHHSEGRHRRDLDRIHNKQGQGFALLDEAKGAADRAAAAEANQAHHLAAGPTMRRIEKHEANIRRWERELTPCDMSGKPQSLLAAVVDNVYVKYEPGMVLENPPSCRICWQRVEPVDGLVPVHGCATGLYKAKLEARIVEAKREIDYWRGHLADLESSGVKVWGPDDFQKGDIVSGGPWKGEVIRVNKKSVTFIDEDDIRNNEARKARGETRMLSRTLPYDKVRTRERPEVDRNV